MCIECTWCGGIPEDNHKEQLSAYCWVRFQAGQGERTTQGHSCAQSQHHVSCYACWIEMGHVHATVYCPRYSSVIHSFLGIYPLLIISFKVYTKKVGASRSLPNRVYYLVLESQVMSWLKDVKNSCCNMCYTPNACGLGTSNCKWVDVMAPFTPLGLPFNNL